MHCSAGSTGNVYQTTIGRSPKCVCMVSLFSIQTLFSSMRAVPRADMSTLELAPGSSALSKRLTLYYANSLRQDAVSSVGAQSHHVPLWLGVYEHIG